MTKDAPATAAEASKDRHWGLHKDPSGRSSNHKQSAIGNTSLESYCRMSSTKTQRARGKASHRAISHICWSCALGQPEVQASSARGTVAERTYIWTGRACSPAAGRSLRPAARGAQRAAPRPAPAGRCRRSAPPSAPSSARAGSWSPRPAPAGERQVAYHSGITEPCCIIKQRLKRDAAAHVRSYWLRESTLGSIVSAVSRRRDFEARVGSSMTAVLLSTGGLTGCAGG